MKRFARWAPTAARCRAARTSGPTCGLLLGLLAIALPGFAQSTAEPDPFQTRVVEAARSFDPPRSKISGEQRRELATFVAANLLFALLHEMGHVAISDLGLPVLGREEDAADSFAVVMLLKRATGFSHRVLVEAAQGWSLTDLRDRKLGKPASSSDEHALDRQRAQQIVCLMVGFDAEKFKTLADALKFPEERRETCQVDYSNASWSWDRVLKPHRRWVRPKTRIDVIYGEANGEQAAFAKFFRSVRLLETVAEQVADPLAWRAPLTMEMTACGESNAHWHLKERRLQMCYEMAAEFAQLYRDYGEERKIRLR